MYAKIAEPPNNHSHLRLDHDSEPRIISSAPGSGQALLGGTPSAAVFEPGAFLLLGVPTMEDDPRSLILAWAKHARDVVAIHRGYVRLTGDIGAGAALSQILYWFDDDKTGTPRARIERDGELWIAKTYDEFAEELGLVDREGNPRGKVARRYVQNLHADGLIEIGVFRFNGAPTIHIRPLWNAIFERAAMALPRKSHLGISEAGKSQMGTLENPAVGKSIKEAKTTTEITSTPVGEGANDAPPRDAHATGDDALRDADVDQRELDRAARHSLGLTIAAEVGVDPDDAVYKRGKQAGRLNADFGEMVGQVRKVAGSYPAAFLVWGAFRDSVPDDQWERFGAIGVVKTRFNRWAANGGAPKIEQARAMFGGGS